MANLTDEITIPVKATLTVDEDTFRGCLSMVQIYAKEHEICGMLLDFDSGGWSPILRELLSTEETIAAYQAVSECRKKKKGED